ncbi:MAG TPA: DUF262 domain-containing protein [Chloroflexota bacterium]|jgi:hypothetical protein|nr:DUF262 domain-containing protein [Chloroflexota bacterium]
MAIEQLKIREIVARAVDKKLDIPEFQREFVWDAEQCKLLVESLYRDYPVGSFLLWDSSTYMQSKVAEGAQISEWIIDGQQRTTALCLLLGMKPYWWPDAETFNEWLRRADVMINLAGDHDRPEFSLPNPVRRQDPAWMSARAVLACEDVEDVTTLAMQLADRLPPEGRNFAHVHARLQKLWQVREREVPIIKTAHEVEDVAEIFARLNRAGTRVREADVVLALAAAKNPGWVREHYLPSVGALKERGWDLEAGIYVRTMTATGFGRARLREVPAAFWADDNLPPVWDRSSKVIGQVVTRLADWGLTSDALLPSTNSLVPLFTLYAKWNDHGLDFPQALRWFLLANRDGRYSGSAITTLDEDVRAVQDADDATGALTALLGKLETTDTVDATEFLNRYDRSGSRFLRLLTYLTEYHNKAIDWVDKNPIAFAKAGALETGFEPHWHHIYPRSVLKKAQKYSEDDINAIANLTVLNSDTNVKRLLWKEPATYLEEFNIGNNLLAPHAVPDTFLPAGSEADRKATWAVDRFPEFIADRAEELARLSTAFLQGLKR